MLHRLSRTLHEINRLSREAPMADFQDAAFAAMKELIRFEYGYWGGGREPVEAVVMHYQHLHRLPTEETSAAFEKVKSRPKHVEFISRCVINAGQAQACDVRKAELDDFYSHFGVDQITTLYTRDGDLGLHHIISLFRSGVERFTEAERLQFESAVPHLLDARRESKLLHISGVNRDACPFTPAALLDKEGAMHFARPAFVELLRREWPDWRCPFVPEAKYSALPVLLLIELSPRASALNLPGTANVTISSTYSPPLRLILFHPCTNLFPFIAPIWITV